MNQRRFLICPAGAAGGAVSGLGVATPVYAYFRLIEGTWKLVGFERMPESRQ